MDEKPMIGAMAAMIGIAMVMGITGAYAQAAAPYCCTICGECFATLDELETHFEAEHPSEPIDIIWES